MKEGRGKVNKIGVVVSKSGDKSVSVLVETLTKHRLYGKVHKVSKKYLVHDADNASVVGDRVSITECRPLSKRKNWRVAGVLEHPTKKVLVLENGQVEA